MSVDLIEKLRDIGVRAPTGSLEALLEEAARHRWTASEVLEKLCALERRERDATNLVKREKKATLGTVKALDRFDWNHPSRIERDAYEGLLSMTFVTQAENVLLRGASGVGKTMLAQNLGRRALERGYTVRFTTLAGCIADLSKQESTPALERRLKHYTRPDLLIVDEIGYLPCDSQAADLLFQIVSRRHEQRSTVITTNLSFKQWSGVFPGAACLTALVDRFMQQCHVLEIDGESWRQRAGDRKRAR